MKKKLKQVLIGTPLADSELGNEKFNVLWGIPVFASDAISSVSYAGEEILLVLIPVLGMLSYHYFLPIVAAIIGLLLILPRPDARSGGRRRADHRLYSHRGGQRLRRRRGDHFGVSGTPAL